MFQNFDDRADPTRAAARVAALRSELKTRGLAGFIVGHGDEYGNEYLPACAERLFWLTGFAGSAGVAIVMADKAALFVDGRYTLQVAEQVDGNCFQTLHITDNPPTNWLKRQLRPGMQLGYDPRLISIDDASKYRAICDEAGAKLAPVMPNPVDAVWDDRPAEPMGSVSVQSMEYAGASAGGKIARLQQALAEQATDTLVITQPENIAWLLNIRGTDVAHTPLPLSYAIMPAAGRPILFIDRRKLDNEVSHAIADVADIKEPGELEVALNNLKEASGTIRLDPAAASDWFRITLSGGGARIQPGADPTVLMKAQKNAAEIEGSIKAHIRDGAAVTRFLAWLSRQKPGTVSEISAAEELERLRVASGRLEEISFDTISAAGPNAALPHYRVSKKSNRSLRENSIYLIDSGGQYRDGTTDITRTVIIGRPNDEMRDRFTRVLKGHIAIAMARFPEGTSGAQIDSFARKSLWEAGLDFDHGTGHGVGSFLSVHEGPARISKVSSVQLKPGMILSNEPGYYKTGHYGIRIENLVVVRGPTAVKGGERMLLHFETLTLAPIEMRLIAPGLLTAQEIQWLDAYHGRVRDKIGPLLDRDDLDWLEKSTSPLM